VFFLLFCAAFVLPVAVLAVYAVAPGWRFPHLWPERFDMRAVRYVFGPAPEGQGGRIVLHLASSLFYSLGAVAVSLVLCLAPARLFARRRFRGKALLEGLLLAPALVPSMTFSMGVHYLFVRLGLSETVAGVVLALTVFTYPFMLRALVTGYQAFGEEYELCARNLGAGPLRRLWRVELPLLLPAAAAGGSVVFLIAFSEYFLVFLIGGGVVPSFTGFLFPLLTSSDRAVASILTLVFLAVPVAMFFVLDALLLRGCRRRGML